MPDNLKDLQKAVQQFQVEQRQPRTGDWLILLARLTRLATALGALILLGVAVSVIWPHMDRIRATADNLLHPKASAPTSRPAANPIAEPAPASLPPISQPPAPALQRPAEPVAVHHVGDIFAVGTWEYSVSAATWQDLFKPAVDKTVWPGPGRKFLVVRLTVCNTAQDAALLPPARLVGPDGSTFDPTSKSGGGAVAEDSLAPDRHYKRQIVFDVPPGKPYKLLLSGGWLSDKQAVVEIGR
jgi:hypothetical protein